VRGSRAITPASEAQSKTHQVRRRSLFVMQCQRLHAKTLLDGLVLKQRRRKLLRVERLQIVRLFADADEFDWQPELLLNRDDHAAFARAVELGDDEAREFYRLVEFTRLIQGVHPRG